MNQPVRKLNRNAILRLATVALLFAPVALAGCGSMDTGFRMKTWEQMWLDGCDALNESRLNEARQLLEQAVPEARALGDDMRLGITLNRLGDAYRKSGMDPEAEKTYAESVEALQRGAKNSTGSDETLYKELANSLSALGQIQLSRQKLKDAETSLQDAIKQAEKIGGANMERTSDKLLVKDYATSLKSLAIIYENSNRMSEAESTYLKAFRFDLAAASDKTILHSKAFDKARSAAAGISVKEETKLNDMIRRWTPLMDAGNRACDEMNWEEAEKNFKAAFDLARSMNQTGTQSIDSLTQLIKTQLKSRKLDEAEKLTEAYFPLIEKAKASKPIDNVLGEMSRTYIRQRKLPQAEKIIAHRVKVRQEVRGPGNTHVAETLYDLGLIYIEEGKKPQAQLVLQKAAQICKENGVSEDKLGVKIREHLDLLKTL